jgi:hypothetical protein
MAVSGYAAAMEDTNPKTVEQLVDELIGSGMLDDDAIADLRQNYLEVWRKEGSLHPDDLAYLTAFHARILDPARLTEELDPEVEVQSLQARLDEALARAERAEARVLELEKQLAESA